MPIPRRSYKKKPVPSTSTSKKTPHVTVVTVRISDDEKVRIDEIMKNLDIKHYSDVMRLALQMVKF